LGGLDGLITDRIDLFEPQARLGSNPGHLHYAVEELMA
jgi:hypothetical protein